MEGGRAQCQTDPHASRGAEQDYSPGKKPPLPPPAQCSPLPGIFGGHSGAAFTSSLSKQTDPHRACFIPFCRCQGLPLAASPHTEAGGCSRDPPWHHNPPTMALQGLTEGQIPPKHTAQLAPPLSWRSFEGSPKIPKQGWCAPQSPASPGEGDSAAGQTATPAGHTATPAGHTATAAAAAAGLGLFLKSWVFLCRRFATVQCHNNNNSAAPSQTSRATPAFFLPRSHVRLRFLCATASPRQSVISRNNAREWKMTRSTSKNQTLKSFFSWRGARSCPIPCGAALRAPRNNRAGHCEPQRASWETQGENSSDSWHGRSTRAGAGNIFLLQF